MYLTDTTISTQSLANAIALSPYSKSAITAFINVYRSAKEFLDSRIFSELRTKVEQLLGEPLNFRKSLDQAKCGRLIAVAELTYRCALPSTIQPLYLLDHSTQQLEIDWSVTERTIEPVQASPSALKAKQKQLKVIQEERDRALASLRQFEVFTQFLLVGRIFPAPLPTNGLENSPLLQVFAGARSLNELHYAYRELRKAWHPDFSPFSVAESNARFHWLRQAYQTLLNHWNRFDPHNLEIPQTRIQKLMNQTLQWSPQSFWYWREQDNGKSQTN